VAEATNGETVANEVIGSGDASAAFQTFKLAKSPVTHVPDPSAPAGAADTVHVSVSGIKWTHARTLYGRKADALLFTSEVGADGTESLSFGDGVNGARLPSGQGNVVATYRKGLGPDGNVPRTTLTTLLDKPLGLKSVTNPGPAYGGADPAGPDDIRAAAPSSVRTFDRIVALADFENAALEYAGVARAFARTAWDVDDEAVRLTVAGPGGDPLSSQVKSALAAYLDNRRDPNRKLVIQDVTQIPVQVIAAVRASPGHQADQVAAAAGIALATGLSFDKLRIGQPIRLSEVYALLQNVPGVLSAEVTRLNFKRASDAQSHHAGTDPVQTSLAIQPDEIAHLDDPATDAVVISWGAQ
jgi:predicted phage baseplate assembly protein